MENILLLRQSWNASAIASPTAREEANCLWITVLGWRKHVLNHPTSAHSIWEVRENTAVVCGVVEARLPTAPDEAGDNRDLSVWKSEHSCSSAGLGGWV